jgi:hypothetical protein
VWRIGRAAERFEVAYDRPFDEVIWSRLSLVAWERCHETRGTEFVGLGVIKNRDLPTNSVARQMTRNRITWRRRIYDANSLELLECESGQHCADCERLRAAEMEWTPPSLRGIGHD